MGGRASALAAMVGTSLFTHQTAAFDHGHPRFDELLRDHVVGGRVNYSEIAEDRSGLDRYLEELAGVAEGELNKWSRSQQLAFWINAYNALAIDAVVENYPLKRRGIKGLAFPSSSIWQVPGVWKKRKRSIAGQERALDDIEHGIIRPTFAEPRIHVALVCAAVSCPELRSEAYVASRLEAQLENQLKSFLLDPDKGVRVDSSRRKIFISSIFKWFPEDFVLPPAFMGELAGKTKQAGVVRFLAEHATGETRDALTSPGFSVGYLKYDWTLNDQGEP